MIKAVVTCCLSSLFCAQMSAQQTPFISLDASTGLAFSRIKVDDIPKNDVRFQILAPSVNLSAKIFDNAYLEAGFRYIKYSGDIEPYQANRLGIGTRYYLNTQDRDEDISWMRREFIKRVSLYGFVRHRWLNNESSPENNRFKDLGEGWQGGIGYTVYPFRSIGLSGEVALSRLGPFYGRGVGVLRSSSITFSWNPWWPRVPKPKSERPTFPFIPNERFAKSRRGLFAELEFGWAPDSEEEADSRGFTSRENPLFYNIAVGMLLPNTLEVGARITYLDAIGSMPERSTRRDQYVFAYGFARSDLAIVPHRLRGVVELGAGYGDYLYLNNAGHVRDDRFYITFSPAVRFVITPKIYSSLAMRFQVTPDRDRNTLASNYPALTLGFRP